MEFDTDGKCSDGMYSTANFNIVGIILVNIGNHYKETPVGVSTLPFLQTALNSIISRTVRISHEVWSTS
jgi:hypothetical protein